MSARADFWSRRRAAVAAEERAEEEAGRQAAAAGERKAPEDRPDAELLAELELPDPDGMKQGDDFSAFMAEAVPERLRRRALRRLWRTNPVLANLDNLVDYGEDYTDAALAVENLQTAYRVGKGMLRHLEAMAEAAEKAEETAESAAGGNGRGRGRRRRNGNGSRRGRGRGGRDAGGSAARAGPGGGGGAGCAGETPDAVRLRGRRSRAGGPETMAEAMTAAAAQGADIAEEERLRADLYDFLAALLARPPDRALLDRAAALTGDGSDLGRAVHALSRGCGRNDRKGGGKANTPPCSSASGAANCCPTPATTSRVSSTRSRWRRCAATWPDSASSAPSPFTNRRTISPA